MEEAPHAEQQLAARLPRPGHRRRGLRGLRRLRQAHVERPRAPLIAPGHMCSGITSAARHGQCRQCAVTLDAGAVAETIESAQSPAGGRSASFVPAKLLRRCHGLHSAPFSCRRIRRTAQRVRGRPRRRAQRQGNVTAEEAVAVRDALAAQREEFGGPQSGSAQWPRRVMAGTGPVVAHAMHDCTPLYRAGDWEALRTRLRLDGYLLLRGVVEERPVLKARDFLLDQLHGWQPEAFHQSSLCKERLVDGAATLGLLARQDLAAAEAVAAVLEAPQLFDLMRGLMQQDGEVVTSGYKWLRAVARGEFTGLHCDRVFLGRGSRALLTAWLPLSSVPTARGSLLVARGSHRLRAFDTLHTGYGTSEVGVDGTRSGWLANDGRRLEAFAGAAAIDWRTADCGPGDVIVLGLDVLHMTASNTTDLVRLSCDTRWQPANEPRDPRLAVWRHFLGKFAEKA